MVRCTFSWVLSFAGTPASRGKVESVLTYPDVQSFGNSRYNFGERQNGGLARRHAVALKIEKPGAKGCLGGIVSAGWLEDHEYSHFRERSCSSSEKNVPVFEVLAIERLPRDSAPLEDCSHVGALQVLVTALRSKRTSPWTLFTS